MKGEIHNNYFAPTMILRTYREKVCFEPSCDSIGEKRAGLGGGVEEQKYERFDADTIGQNTLLPHTHTHRYTLKQPI